MAPPRHMGIFKNAWLKENKGVYNPSIDAHLFRWGGMSGRHVEQPWWNILIASNCVVLSLHISPFHMGFPVALWPKRLRLMLKSTALGTDAVGCPTPWKANLAKWSMKPDWLRLDSPRRFSELPSSSPWQKKQTIFFTSKQWVMWIWRHKTLCLGGWTGG